VDESQRKFASEDEEATWCLSLLRDGDRNQKIVARERLSQIFERRGLLDEVAQCLESNIREGVRDPRVYQRLSGIYRRQGRHELADEVLVEARRLAERAGRPPAPPPGPAPIRGGRPPGRRRQEPPPHPLEAPTAQLPASTSASNPPPPAPASKPPAPPPFVPPPPGAAALGELSLDAPRPPADEPSPPVDRPWWISPPAIILGLLLCGPFGAFVVAAMWVRGGYEKRARITAAAVWAGLMILQSAAVAIWLQSMVAGILADPGRLAGQLGPGLTPTPLVFPTPAAGTSPQQPQTAAPKPAAAPSPPAFGLSPEAAGSRPSPAVNSPAQPTAIAGPAASSAPSGAQPAASTSERVRVVNTGGSGANLRERPGASAPIVKTVPDGSVLQIVGADQQADGMGWRNVRDAEGAQGWVAAELVERAP
jgi:hypothetical protein